jgi:hypothetical protein
MRALFAAVELRVTLWAIARQVGFRGQGGGAVEAPRSGDMLHQSWKTGTGHVQGRTRALRFGPVFAKAVFALARVHVPVLSVFTIAVHGESYSVLMGEKERCSITVRTLLASHQNADRSHEAANRRRGNDCVVGISEGLDGNSEVSANNRSEPASASNTYVPRTDMECTHLRKPYPTELHFIRLAQGRVRGSS